MEKLKLKVHSSGYDSTFQPLNMETAWLHVDLPCGNKPGADSTTVIFGDPQPSRIEAHESACQAVLNYYCNVRDVSINDFSHGILKMKQHELDASNFFCAAMQDRVVRLVLERDAAISAIEKHRENMDIKTYPLSEAFIKKKQDQLNNDCFYEILQDKINKLLQDRNVQKQRYTNMINDLASICDSFGDLLPIQKVHSDEAISADTETRFIFTGNKTSPSHSDQLALALLKLLRDGIIYETKHATTPFCTLLSLCNTICLYACLISPHLTDPQLN